MLYILANLQEENNIPFRILDDGVLSAPMQYSLWFELHTNLSKYHSLNDGNVSSKCFLRILFK